MSRVAELPSLRWNDRFFESWEKLWAKQAAREWRRVLVVVVSYYLCASMSRPLHFGTSSLALIWPSNAILVAVLAFTPNRRWWLYLLAVVPAHVAALAPLHLSLGWLLYQIVHNSLLAIVIASILRAYSPSIFSFQKLRETLIFLAASIFIPGLVSFVLIFSVLRLIPGSVLVSHGWTGSAVSVWLARWLTNAVSLLIFLPPILISFSRDWNRRLAETPRQRYFEISVFALLLLLGSFSAFGLTRPSVNLQTGSFLVTLPLLLWATVRLGALGTSTSLVAVVLVSSWSAYWGLGPFVQPAHIERGVAMQICWILLATPLLALAAIIEENRIATRALLESENLFSHLFDQASIGVAIESQEGRLVSVNPALCAILGYTREELLQLSCLSLSHPQDVEAEKPLFNELVSGSRLSYEIEKRFFKKDGVVTWGHVYVSLLRQPGQKAPLIIGMLEDVTARKTAELQLQTSESSLKQRDRELRKLAGRLIQAQDAERQRISRELHDDIGQEVSELADGFEALDQEIMNLQMPGLSAKVRYLRERASELATDIHTLSHDLHSSRLQHLGLASALKEIIEKLTSQHHIGVDFRSYALQQRLPDSLALCLYRIAQEALNNVVRHSKASLVEIEIAQMENEIVLRIRDNGAGFDMTVPSAGIGLTSMKERAHLVGGSLQITSSAEWGTEVSALVPNGPNN